MHHSGIRGRGLVSNGGDVVLPVLLPPLMTTTTTTTTRTNLVRDGDGAVCGLSLGRLGAGHGVALGAEDARINHRLLPRIDHITILGVHLGGGAGTFVS